MNRLLLIVLAVLCVSAFTDPVQACECREYGTPICARLWRSDAVFVGQVVDIKPLKRKPDDVYTYVMERFKVQESFRGVSGPTVVPGGYHLFLNARAKFDAPYARTYYPATEDSREAKTIQVTEGATIENLVVRVRPRLSERRVAGTVEWKSGRRLEWAHIAVYSRDEYVRYVSIDGNGRFNFMLYGNYDFSIEARDSIDEIEGRSQRIKIPQGDSTALKLVIQRIK